MRATLCPQRGGNGEREKGNGRGDPAASLPTASPLSASPLTTPMTRLRSFPLAVVLGLAASVAAQPAFEAKTHDFGRVVEGDGPVSHTFRFTNAGAEPLRLVRVEAACGCTTPDWTDDALAPGASGTLAVVYDPAGRPGPFDKTVFVATEAGDSVVLRITGSVEPALARSGVRVGAFAFDAVDVDAGVVAEGEPLQTAVQFAHVGTRPVRIERVEAPAGVEVSFSDRPIFPDALGGLFVTVPDPAALAEAGRVAFDVVLHTTDAAEPVKTLRVSARLAPPAGW